MPARPASNRKKPQRRQATPARMSASMRCDGLVIRIGVPGMEGREIARVAKRVVNDSLPGDEWSVRLMGVESRDVIVRRKATQKNPTAAQAFEYARKLQTHRDVEDCEPSLYMPGDAPEMMRAEFEEANRIRHESPQGFRSSSSSDGSDHQTCSDNHDWVLELAKATRAWSLPRPNGGRARGEGIVIGHPDTGYTRHPQLDRSRVLHRRGRDFEQGDSDPTDTLEGLHGGHGTSTGSVIMSSEDADITGVAPLAELVPLRVTTNVVLFSFGKLAEAIQYAADDGHDVVSISLGGPIGSRFLRRSVQYAVERGTIVIAAAGNVWPWVVYPAKLDEVIAVAACNCKRAEWSKSASGSAVDITAPGESVWRALADTSGFSIGRSSGTSYAVAVTAGAAALWLAHHGRDRLISRFGLANLSAVFKELLKTRGFDRPRGWDTSNFGPGILNVEKLLSAPLPNSPPARGMMAVRSAAPVQAGGQTDQLAEVFPASSPMAVRTTMMQLLAAADSELEDTMASVGDEIAYHAVTDMEFRESMLKSLSKNLPKQRATTRRTNTSRAIKQRAGELPKRMSKTLKKLAT